VKRKSQLGMTVLSMMVLVLLGTGALLLGMRIAPLYLDDFSIAKHLDSLQTEQNLYDMSKTRIRDLLARKLDVDYGRGLTKDEVTIEKTKKIVTIDVVYEERVSLVYNLDVVAKFDHHIEQENNIEVSR